MSSADEKGNVIAASGTWWLIPRLLTVALVITLLLILIINASIISFDFPTYVSPISPSSPFLNTHDQVVQVETTKSEPAASGSGSLQQVEVINLESKNEGKSRLQTETINKKTAANGSQTAVKKETDIITSQSTSWISVPTQPNFTSTLLSRWFRGSDTRTVAISVPALDGVAPLNLSTAEIHDFTITTLDGTGNAGLFGGDYFETDLSSDSWKSRPPVTDHGNGSYTFKLQVHPDFPGNYTLTITLLFRSFEGLKYSPERFKFRRELRKVTIHFYRNSYNVTLPDLKICKSSDFLDEIWSGRWTRHVHNGDCSVDNDGRYRCLDTNFPCQSPWCMGPLGMLESNGWVYSAHCSFRIFTQDLAWKCLNNKWLFFWGDSNHVDTIRNLLSLVLGLTEITSVPRRFDLNFTNPTNKLESVRITSIFNGHWNDTKNYLGLESLRSEYFRNLLWGYFLDDRVPDVMIFNSGLHDGVYWRSIRAFAEGAEYAAKFWNEIFKILKEKGIRLPKIFYRTTIATGGYARDLAFNPNKMEAFNGVLLEKLKDRGLITGGVVDEFDMTYPWHYDNRCNDGVHYGRAPAKTRWRDGEIGHQYFVDLMLIHVLLNAICND